MDEEFILYQELELDEILEEINEIDEVKESSNIIINGDVIIEVQGKEEKKKKNTRKLRVKKVKKPWKNKIKNRDENKCQCCRKTFPEHLQVHHIMPFSKYPDLAEDDRNGISLCQKCHNKYHTLYKGKESAVTFAQFLRDYGNRIYR